MTLTARRSIAFGVAPAVLAVGAVAGCNNGAPSVQAPPVTAASTAQSTSTGTDPGVPTVAPTDTAPTDTAPTDTASTDDQGVPTMSSAPSSATGDPAKVCTKDPDSFSTPAVLAPSTKKTTWGKSLELSQKYSGAVTLTAEKPVAKKPASDDFFAPKDQVYLLIKVTAKYKSGDSTFLGSSFFTLRDTQQNACDRDVLGDVVPQRERFSSVTIKKGMSAYVGTLVFEVPPGQDYSHYTLMYLTDSFDTKDAAASIAWTK